MATESATVAANETTRTFGTSRPDPGMYSLSRWVSMLPLKMDGKECLFGNAWDRLSLSRIKEIENHSALVGDVYVTEAGKVQIAGEGTAGMGTCDLLRSLLELHRKGVDPFAATWFPYDWSHYEDVAVHSFFVLYNGRIVEEEFTFPSYSPLVLERPALYKDPEIHNRRYRDGAWECHWYRKFYMEALTGQLMVLRSDEPPLYCFARPKHDLAPEVTLAVLTKTYYLLWVVIPLLVAIAFPSIRLVMAISSVALLFLWALVCWRLRKIGEG